MSKKRQSSSVVSIMDEDNIDIQDIDDESMLTESDDSASYMNVDISTDNIWLKIIILRRTVCDPYQIRQIRMDPIDFPLGNDASFLILDLFVFKQMNCHFSSSLIQNGFVT